MPELQPERYQSAAADDFVITVTRTSVLLASGTVMP